MRWIVIFVASLIGRTAAAWPTDPQVNVAICTAPDDQGEPVIASDGAGGAIVAWDDRRAGGQQWHIFAQHVLATGEVDGAWPENGRRLCAAATSQTSPTIVADGAGGAVIVWLDHRNANADIFAQRVQANGQIDPSWPPDGLVVCSSSSYQTTPVAVLSCPDAVVVAWGEDLGGPSDVYAGRILLSGAVDPSWPANGLAVCTAVSWQGAPGIVADGAGGAVISWVDWRTDVDSDPYAQHVLGSGQVDPDWPINGRALCTAPGNQGGWAIVADGSGGAIVGWPDNRGDPTAADIYAQHVLGGGGDRSRLADGWQGIVHRSG